MAKDSLPPLAVAIHRTDGKFQQAALLPDPREGFCKAFNEHGAQFGLVARAEPGLPYIIYRDGEQLHMRHQDDQRPTLIAAFNEGVAGAGFFAAMPGADVSKCAGCSAAVDKAGLCSDCTEQTIADLRKTFRRNRA